MAQGFLPLPTDRRIICRPPSWLEAGLTLSRTRRMYLHALFLTRRLSKIFEFSFSRPNDSLVNQERSSSLEVAQYLVLTFAEPFTTPLRWSFNRTVFLFRFYCSPTSDDRYQSTLTMTISSRSKTISCRSNANLTLFYNCTQLYYFVCATSNFPTITSSVKSRAYNTVMHLNLVIISQSHVSFPYLATLPACPYISFLSKLTEDFVYNCVISFH